MPHPRQPLRLYCPGGTTPRDPPAPMDAASAAAVRDLDCGSSPPLTVSVDGIQSRQICRQYTTRGNQRQGYMVYHELTVWPLGIIVDKEARDVSSCVAAAAPRLGYHSENVSDYVDHPDRPYCLGPRCASICAYRSRARFL